MTNAEIIMEQQEILFEAGILHENEDGEIQEIHTFQAWKKQGFQVKKGEKAIAKFPVWKFTKSKKQAEEESENEEDIEKKGKGYFFKKMSAFFTEDQVEKIVAKEEVA